MKAELIEKITDIVYEEVVKNNYGKATLTAKLNELLNNYNVVKNIAYEPVLADVRQQSELLLQAYKEGFDAATASLIGANKVVQERKLQQ